MQQKDIAAMFGGKAKVSTNKSAVIRSTIKADISVVDNLLKSEDIKTLKVDKMPNELKSLVFWEEGKPIPFMYMAKMLEEAEPITERNILNELFAKYFLTVILSSPKDLIPMICLLTGILRPKHEGVKLNLGEEILYQAIALVVGTDKKSIESKVKAIGDLGEVAKTLKSSQKTMGALFGTKTKEYSIRDMYNNFLDIANLEGEKSTNNRVKRIQGLLSSVKADEVKYVVRMLQGKLRIGASLETFLISLGYAFKRREFYTGLCKKLPDEEEIKEYGKQFKALYKRFPVIDRLIAEFLKGSFEGAEKNCNPVPGVPMMPMLAKPAKSQKEIIQRLGEGRITGEYKYDGQRGQIHKRKNGKVSIYSRNADDSTAQFADIADIIKENVKGEDFIIDSEIVAYDTVKDIILPFQVLMTRPKKGEEKPTIQVCVFAFDILFLDGESLIKRPLEERRRILHEVATPVPGKFMFAVYKDADDIGELQSFFDEAVANRTEGLMVKTLAGEYEPGRRAQSWGKLKKDYIENLNGTGDAAPPDTLDAVVIGATYGVGKRTSVYGSYLLALYNEDTGRFQSLTFIGTGFSDEKLKELFEEVSPLEVGRRAPSNVECAPLRQNPVFVEPKLVWEIAFADIQKSPDYMCARGEFPENVGLSVRFPRFVRSRPDKDPTQCTSISQFIELYYQQFNK